MKRFHISIAIAFVAVALSANVAFAQTKSLQQAALEGDVDQVKALLDKGQNVNEQNRQGYAPLHSAARYGHKEIVELILGKGANVNAKERTSKTALFLAAEYNHKEIVELLLAKGADVNVIAARGENALSIAKKKGYTEIAKLLEDKGATEPTPQDIYGDEYYGEEGMYPGARGGSMPGSGAPRALIQPAVQVDLLADPNEISARIKTFDGLEKEIVNLANKSSSEMRYWGQSRYDNRTSLLRAVQKQIEDELAVVRKIAVEEKAEKTTEAIDALVKKRQEREKVINRELLQQRRETAAQGGTSSRSGGRGRSTGRSRGRTSVGGDQAYGGATNGGAYGGGAYDDGGDAGMGRTARGARGARSARPDEVLDRETEDEMRQWLQTTMDKKDDLAKALHPIIHNDIALIRQVAVEEEAKKTTAAIDGILLARKVRHDVYVAAAEQLRQTEAQGQDPRTAGRYGDQAGRATAGRTRGGRTRGGTTSGTQQQNTQGGRVRRR